MVSGAKFETIPTRYYVYQNYPNPFNPSTTIKYEIPIDGMVKIEVYNILGEKVKVLVNQELEAGYHEIEFRAENLASGTYIYRITAGNPSTGSGQGFVDVKKMMYLK